MRLIDADALTEKAYWHGEHPDVENLYAEGVEAVDMCDIDEAPTIEAEPVRHGRWDDDHKCTVCRKEALYEQKPDPYACGLLTLFYVDSTYCPNCGAKMDGDADDD